MLGEGSNARLIQRMLLRGDEAQSLAHAGVGWIIVESGTPGEIGSASKTLTTWPTAYHDDDFTLYRVGGGAPGASSVERTVMIAAHLLWLGALTVGGVGAAVGAARRGAATGSDEAAHEAPDAH